MTHEANALNPRVQVSDETRKMALQLFLQDLERRLQKKGTLSFAGKHEALGVIAEEYFELTEAVHSKILRRMIPEALDLAVGAIWMVASILEKYPDLKTEFMEALKP